MPSSVSDSVNHQERVQSYLRKTVPDCELTAESLLADYPPLVLMWTARRLAAFAFSNGDTCTSYEKLYRGFKRYYTENRERLDDLDLSFVFCVRPDAPNLEQFCSEIETDVYFCRKFVVLLDSALDRSFQRLPFLPLKSARGESGRPLSAQTYMQQLGVSAKLAKYLAVPYQRGTENIVRDCIENRSNWIPTLASHGEIDVPPLETDRDVKRVGLDSLCIENFRAYKKRQVFEFGDAVTLLYGPNGFGKTSLFDAIDFAVTGGVGRLRVPPSTQRFTKAVAHLDSEPQEASVALAFAANGRQRKIIRRVTSRMYASLDNATCDRKKTLLEVTGGGVTPPDRVEHLVSLFRATHLFSQERQELAKEFDRDCALPAQVVSRMLAVDDYATTRDKTAKVHHLLEERVVRSTTEIRTLTNEVEDEKRTLHRLAGAGAEYRESVVPADALAALSRRIRDAGLSVPSEKLDRDFVRACRAAIQMRLTEGESRIVRLTALVQQVRALSAVTEGLANLVTRRTRAEADMQHVNSALIESQEAVEGANERVAEFGSERLRISNVVDAAHWARVTRPRYATLIRREADGEEAVREATSLLGSLRDTRSKAITELQRREHRQAESARTLTGLHTVATELEELVRSCDAWSRDRARIGNLEERHAIHVQRLGELHDEEKAVASLLGQNAAKRQKLEQEIVTVGRKASELSKLLSHMERLVDDGCCPLCGHDHGSAEDLLSAITILQVQDGIGDLRRQSARLRRDREELEGRLAGSHEAAERETAAVEDLRTERAKCTRRIVAFEEAAVRVGVTVKEPAAMPEEILQPKAHVRNRIRDLEGMKSSLEKEADDARAEIAELERRIRNTNSTVIEARRNIDECRGELAGLRSDKRVTQQSLDTDATKLEKIYQHHSEELRRTDSMLSEAVATVRKSKAAASKQRQRMAALTATLDGLTREIIRRRKTVAETVSALAEYGLGEQSEEADIVRLLEDVTRINGQMTELRDFADSVEIAIDTATTAAALREQREAIQKKERRIEEAIKDVDIHRVWLDYFRDVIDRVSAKQHAEIESFAKNYGPMASVIQQRLRSVYGFQGIDTQSHKATIRVRVSRGGDVLRPTDYFSHSEQQTLLLGLFLTAIMSQTWSALSTVLLDDPVTHFDDLNTYAFLDMIIGLSNGQTGTRQFVISTCDEKMFQLARMKFRQLRQAAKFYKISAIGRDGPVVQEITSGHPV